jgi:hypothetical protein
MINWLKKIGETDSKRWDKKMEALEQKIEKLERLVGERPVNIIDIKVDTVKLDRAVLESLSFHLDKLDIKELSGALNVGNNFGGKPDPELKPKEKHPPDKPAEPAPAHSPRADLPQINSTASGFSYRRTPNP